MIPNRRELRRCTTCQRLVPHVATCKGKATTPTLPPNVVRLDAHRSARRR